MKIVGLVGGSGVGKGTVCSVFKKYNFASIDTDAVYHKLTSTPDSACLAALKEAFGSEIITSDGVLDRRALSGIVFAEGAEEKRELLNKIAHKYVLDEVRRQIPVFEKEGYFAVLVDAPLLFESGFDKECDIILCVIAPKNARIERIILRDGISKEAAEARISAQLSDEYLKEHSDIVIYNDKTLSELEAEIEKIVKKLKRRYK